MWFKCFACDMILPIYEVDPESAKYSPFDEMICFECAWDMRNEYHEEPELEDHYPEEDSPYCEPPWDYEYDGE